MNVRLLILLMLLLKPFHHALCQSEPTDQEKLQAEHEARVEREHARRAEREALFKRAREAREALRGTTQALADGDPAFTAAEADALIAELLPLVEQAAGRKFHTPPPHELVDTGTVAQALARDLLPQFESLGQDMSAAEAAEAAARSAKLMAPLMLGKWGLVDRKIYLLPRRVEPIAKIVGIDPEHELALVQLIVAHELVHALQEQEAGIGARLSTFTQADEAAAFGATIEGHATFVSRRVGRQLGLSQEQLDSFTQLISGAAPSGDPAQSMLAEMARSQFEQLYLGGERFCAFHHAEGGDDRLWEILASPPGSTSMISNPETYSPELAERLDLATALEGFERLFGERPWQVQNMEVGAMLLAAAYSGLDPDDSEKILAQVRQTQSFKAEAEAEGKPDIMGKVSVVLLRDADFAGPFLQMLRAATQANIDRLAFSEQVTVEGYRFQEVDGLECDASLLTTLYLGDGGYVQEHRAVRAARDGVLVELIASNLGLDDETLVMIVEEAFRRYEEVAEGELVGAGESSSR